jgi:olefin beta-lactone synthetase
MDNYNIVSAVFDKAVSQPETLAIAVPERPGKPIPPNGIIPYREINFKEFAIEIDSIARGLLANGFQKGDRVVMLVPPSFDFFTISFALMQCGIIPVLIDPGIGIKNLKKCIGDVDPVGFIGISKAHVARILLGWGRGKIKKKVTIGPRLFWGGHSFERIKQDGKNRANKENGPMEIFHASKDDLAAILFTSGSTGISKGVSYTFGNFKLQIESIQRTFGMESGEIDLPTFPPFALFNPTVGMSTIIPDMDPTKPAHVDPEKIIVILKRISCTH